MGLLKEILLYYRVCMKLARVLQVARWWRYRQLWDLLMMGRSFQRMNVPCMFFILPEDFIMPGLSGLPASVSITIFQLQSPMHSAPAKQRYCILTLTPIMVTGFNVPSTMIRV